MGIMQMGVGQKAGGDGQWTDVQQIGGQKTDGDQTGGQQTDRNLAVG